MAGENITIKGNSEEKRVIVGKFMDLVVEEKFTQHELLSRLIESYHKSKSQPKIDPHVIRKAAAYNLLEDKYGAQATVSDGTLEAFFDRVANDSVLEDFAKSQIEINQLILANELLQKQINEKVAPVSGQDWEVVKGFVLNEVRKVSGKAELVLSDSQVLSVVVNAFFNDILAQVDEKA
jgi:hypothetical protein